MARRTVRKRTNLTSYPDLPWVAACSACRWEHLAPTQARAFGKALRHLACFGFARG